MVSINEFTSEIREYTMAENMRNLYGDDPSVQIPLLVITEPSMPDWQVLQHKDFVSLYFIMSGRGTHIVGNQRYAISRGDIYLLGVGDTHRFVNCHDLVATTVHFSLGLFDQETLGALRETPGFRSLFIDRSDQELPDLDGRNARWLHVGPDTLNSISADLDEIKREINSSGPERKALVRALMLRHMIRLSRHYETYPTANVTKTNLPYLNETSVAAAVRFIDENFSSSLRVNELVKMVHVSPDHFTEIFSAVMGRTPSDYIRHVRLENAKAQLRKSDLPITQVALECGLSDHANLSRIFRISTGLTPSQYRAQFHSEQQ